MSVLLLCLCWWPCIGRSQTSNDPGISVAGVTLHDSTLYVDEDSGTVTVNVLREGDFNFRSSVHYRVTGSEDSAAPGLDFVPVEGWLDFGPNETNKSFSFAVLPDVLIEGDEACLVLLDEATGGVNIRTPRVQVVIRDGERHPMRVDPNFNPDWRYAYASESYLFEPQPDGKLVCIQPANRSTGEEGAAVIRLMPDGKPDPSWAAPIVRGSGVYALCIETNGRVLLGAEGFPGPDFIVDGQTRRHVARLNADGSLDTNFSVMLPTVGCVSDIALQSDGGILVAMERFGPVAPGNPLVRLLDSGQVDPTFQSPAIGGSGFGRQDLLFPSADGSIFCVGTNGSVVRLLSDGCPDPAFSPPSNVWPLAALPDGQLLVDMRTSDTKRLARLTLSGQWDTGFDCSWALPNVPFFETLASDGKIWVGVLTSSSELLLRLNPDGSRDQSWPGATIVGMFGLGILGAQLTCLSDGNLLVSYVPQGFLNGHPRGVLARLLVDAQLPRFEADPASATVVENAGRTAIQILRCGTNIGPVSVQWQTAGGTALPGVHYVPCSGTLTFGSNQSVALIQLEVLNNSVVDVNRTVRLRLQGPPPESREYPFVEITILNDDLGFPPGGIRRFASGRVLLRGSGYLLGPPESVGSSEAILEASSDLQNWDWAGWFDEEIGEFVDHEAVTNAVRFYRLREGPY